MTHIDLPDLPGHLSYDMLAGLAVYAASFALLLADKLGDWPIYGMILGGMGVIGCYLLM